jgi:hypothetical protein
MAVALVCGQPPDLARGAVQAARHSLAGLFLEGLGARANALEPAARQALRRAAQREAADDALFARELADVLARVAPLGPVVIKGRALAALWPRPSLRPPGDLDLLLPQEQLSEAAARLGPLGYRAAQVAAGGGLRARPTGIELIPPAGRRLMVDLHARLFRSVGAGIEGEPMIARARPAEVAGHQVRALDDADRLVYVFVHAAKHAVRELKWLLDLHAVAALSDETAWSAAMARVRSAGALRPFLVAARLAASLPGAARPPLAIDLPPLSRVLLDRLISVEQSLRGARLTRWERYALELLLEERLAPRARRLAGVVERLVRRG